jgi:hypothetical protein
MDGTHLLDNALSPFPVAGAVNSIMSQSGKAIHQWSMLLACCSINCRAAFNLAELQVHYLMSMSIARRVKIQGSTRSSSRNLTRRAETRTHALEDTVLAPRIAVKDYSCS